MRCHCGLKILLSCMNFKKLLLDDDVHLGSCKNKVWKKSGLRNFLNDIPHLSSWRCIDFVSLSHAYHFGAEKPFLLSSHRKSILLWLCVFFPIISGITLVIRWTTFHRILIPSSINWQITLWCWIIAYSMMYLATKGSLQAR